jgi:hemerythrin-like domain-containing protein
MDIEHYRQQHEQILGHVSTLRELIAGGIGTNADAIARELSGMSMSIRFHLASEDSVLYPALRASSHPEVAAVGERFQSEMDGIAGAYAAFVGRWRVGAHIASSSEEFRAEANAVFKALHERIRREEQELYPVAERVLGAGRRDG